MNLQNNMIILFLFTHNFIDVCCIDVYRNHLKYYFWRVVWIFAFLTLYRLNFTLSYSYMNWVLLAKWVIVSTSHFSQNIVRIQVVMKISKK